MKTYRALDPQNVIETIAALRKRIFSRRRELRDWPGSQRDAVGETERIAAGLSEDLAKDHDFAGFYLGNDFATRCGAVCPAYRDKRWYEPGLSPGRAS